jgi:hypothetical protein
VDGCADRHLSIRSVVRAPRRKDISNVGIHFINKSWRLPGVSEAQRYFEIAPLRSPKTFIIEMRERIRPLYDSLAIPGVSRRGISRCPQPNRGNRQQASKYRRPSFRTYAEEQAVLFRIGGPVGATFVCSLVRRKGEAPSEITNIAPRTSRAKAASARSRFSIL